jgi:hypothetical protein
MATPDHPIVLIGVVGYSPLIEAYPLGPRLMRRLEAEPWRVTARSRT